MSGELASRGADLTASGEAPGLGPVLLARLWSGGVARVLDRLDKGLERGSISALLPDGSRRVLGGRAPGFDCEVHLRSARALLRLATGGSVGWYQAWEAGEWSSPDPVPLFALFMDNADALGSTGRAHGPWRWLMRRMHSLRQNTKPGSLRNIHAHYDLGNDFYAAWLDPTMSYSSALYAGGAITLEQAQRAKQDAIARRLGDAGRVLEIGCGWGSLAAALAARGKEVTAISLSDEQLDWARAHHGGPGLDFVKQDYRDARGQFDGIASVEMVEAVGREYWPSFLDCIARCLVPGGRAAIQYIAMREELFKDYARSADFIQTYVFPGGILIREAEFRALAEERGLAWTDQCEFGEDYADTLKAWRERFDAAAANDTLPAGFDRRFVDLWRFYLMYCEGGFRGRGITVSQVTLVRRA